MSTINNPYAATKANHDDNAAMNNASQGGLASATGSSGAIDPPADQAQANKSAEEVDFENEDFMVPPSFGRELSEESLKNDVQPYILWANLKIPAPEKPGNASDAMFDCLANFIKAAADEDKQFQVFPYHLSCYKSVMDLPPSLGNGLG